MSASNTSTVTYYSPLEFVGTVTAGTINATSVVTSGPATYNNLSASSAVATDGSKNLVSVTNTGTGNNVLSASPTLTGTISAAAITASSTVSATQYTSTISTGTAPLVVASTTNVANLNASSLSGATFASPGAIGSTTASTGAFTTVTASSTLSATQYTSTITTGTAPLVVASTTNVANLNASLLNGSTFALPSPIGSTTANTGAFTTLSTSGLLTAGAGLTSTAATNNFGATTMSGAIAMGTNKITGLGYPTANTDAASKLYVDTVSQGLDAKDSVRAATTVNGTLATAYENGDVVDGVTLVTGNRILLKNQTDPIENGIYIVAASGAPTRSSDFAAASTPTGAYTFVEEGTVNISAGFVTTAPAGTNTVGTHAMPFTQFSGAGQITAGTGLTKTGNTLSVNASQTQITSVGTLTALTVSPGTSSMTAGTFSTTIDVTGVTTLRNTLDLVGSTTGIISIKTQSAAGTYNFNLPTTSGSSLDVLTSAGGAGAPMTWTTSTGTGNNVLSASPTLTGTISAAAITASSTVSATQYTSTISTGTAPLVVASTTNVANLNASSLSGATFASPGAIGSTTASTGAFTTLSTSGLITANAGMLITSSSNGAPSAALTVTNTNSGAGAYSIINVKNDTANAFVMFLNSSAKTADGGVLTGTLRNDGGSLRLQNAVAGGSTILLSGTTVSVTGALTVSALLSASLGLTVTGANTSVTSLSASGLVSANLGLTVTGANTSVTTLSASGLISANLGLTVTGANTSVTTLSASTTTASTSNTTGAITTAGGIASSNTTDATSSTNGGSFTTAGGMAVAKKVYIGDTLNVTSTLTANNLIGSQTTTATAAGTTILTATSTLNQIFTGTTTQTIQLPDGTTIPVGWQSNIINQSTQNLTVVDAGSNTIATVYAGKSQQLILSVSSVNGTWALLGSGSVTSVAASVPSFLSISGSPITSSGTLAITYSGTALPVANGGTGSTTSTGTGAVVLANTPTLITPVLGAATGTSLNLSGLTASQVVVTDGSKNLASLGYSSTPTASFIVRYDADKNVTANNLIGQSTTTATAAGTTILTVASTLNQIFTGTTTQTIQLPDGTTIPVGWQSNIINQSTQNLTVVDAGSNTVATVYAGKSQQLILSVSSVNGTWALLGSGSVTSVAASVPSFLSISGSPITSSGTLAITYSGTALPVANGGTGSTTSTGTGAVVLANTPTLITPVLGAATGTSASWTSTVSATQYTSTISTGTAPLVVASTTNVANLNASSLSGATFASPGAIGSTTASTGAFTTLSTSGLITANAGMLITSSSNGAPSAALTVTNTNSGNGAYSIINVKNDTANAFVMFLNSSAKTSDGGVLTGTLRNDGGSLKLQNAVAGGSTILLSGTTVSVTGALTVSALLSASLGLTVTGANTSVTTLSASGLVSANLGLTVTGANTSVTTLSASGLVSANLGLTVTGANTSVTTLSASGLISANLGLTVTGATTSVTTLTASGLITASAGLTSTAGTTALGVTNMSGAIAMGTNKITGLGYPTASTDAASKLYVDTVAQGLDAKDSVRVATTANGTLATDFENGDTIDGITLVTGNRILIKNQTDPIENGIYIVAASGAPTRAADFAAASIVTGAFTFVEDGSVNASAGFVTLGTVTVNSDALSFVQFSGAGQITAGTGLTKTGNTLSVNASQTQITTVGTLTALTVTGLITGNLGLTVTGANTSVTTLSTSGLLSANLGLTVTGANTSVTSLSASGLITANLGLTVTGATTSVTSLTASSTVSATQYTSTISTGTAPLVVASTTNVANLNASSLSGATFAAPGPIGSTTASTGAFTTLTSSGATTLGASNSLLTVNGGIKVTADGGLPLSPSGAGAFLYYDTNGYASMQLNGSSASTGGSLIDFSSSAVDYKGRILYTNSTNVLEIHTNGGLKISQNDTTTSFPLTTASTSSSTGAITTAGGISSSNATDATSSTNGGSITTAGGLAVAKKAFIGTDLSAGGLILTSTIAGSLFAQSMSGALRVNNTNASPINKLIVLFDSGPSDAIASATNFYGFGVNNGVVRYQTPASSNHVFYAGATVLVNIGPVSTSFPTATASTSNTTGAIITTGGISSSNTTDASSSTNGGSFTTAGGMAVAKKVYVGDLITGSLGLTVTGANTSVTTLSASGLVSANLGLTVTGANTSVTTLSASGLVTTNAGIALTGDLTMAGSSSGIVSIKTQAAAGTFNFNLPVTAGSTGQVLASAGGAGSPMTWKTVLSSSQSSFGGVASASNANVTGLVFTAGSFETNVIVDVVATTNLSQVFKLSGLLSGGASGWNLTAVGISGDATGVTFSITSGGQIRYSSTAYAGFVSLTITWTDYINAAGLLNLTSGVNVSKVISGTDGPLFNVSGATVTDSGTANSGTLALFSANYIGRPTIAATGTSVTTTQANTVFIAGEPIAGTNETITNKHALKIGAGGKIGMDGSTSGTVSITTQAAAGTFNFNLPVTAGSSGQVLASAGGSSSPMTWVSVATSAIAAGSFAGANNQSSPANITGLVFSSGYFKIAVIVTVVATTNATEYFEVYGVLSNNTGTGWALTSTSVAGDTTGAAITINSSGQLLYTSANHAGFTSITFAWA